MSQLSPVDKQTVLHWAQYGIRVYIWFQAFTLISWSFFTIIPGVGDSLKATETGFHSVSQVGFWMAYEILLLAIGGTVISLNSKSRTLRNATTLYVAALVLGIGANIVHIVASAFELQRCTSLLCMTSPAVLVTLLVFYALLAFFECVVVYLTVRYRQFLMLRVKKR